MRPAALLLSILPTLTWGAGPAAEIDALRIPHRKFVLGNGLTLIVHEDHSVPIVAVNVWYHVGSRNERRGRTGLAHLFEHFFFNGSANYPHGFREAMDDLGANNRNGTTSNDRTNFFEDVPVSGLERTLYLEADRMGFLAGNLSREMLERERGVVQNEKRQGENQPYGRVFTRIVESIYPHSHPYSWPVLGSMQDLEAASLDDLQEWYRIYYGPNNCVLALAGDVTYDRALELVRKYFGAIPPGPPIPRYRRWIPRFEGNVRDQLEDRVPQARIYRVWHVPGWGDKELIDLGLAASVLGGSKSAPLERRLVYERELATEVSVFAWDKEVAGNFVVTVNVKPGVDPAAAERELDAIFADYVERGPSPAELERARTRLVADFIRGIERLGGFGGRSDVLAESMTFGGHPEAFLDRFRALYAATPAQVRDSGLKWLAVQHYTLTVIPHPELQAAPEETDRSVVPDLGAAGELRFPEMQERRLANGLRLLLLERQGAPIVNFTLAVDAGFAADPEDASGLASLALELMEEGTKTRDAFRLADDLDALGATISSGSSLDLSFVRLRALEANLAPSLAIYADVVRNPAFSDAMVRLGKRRQLAQIQQEQAQPTATALRLAPRLLYGKDHAYGHPLTGTGYEESVERLERSNVAQWHALWFHPNNSTLIVAGAVTLDELVPQVERTFGDWPRGTPPRKNVADVAAQPRTAVYLVDRPDAQQTVIVAAHVSERGGRPEDLAMETVTQLFGGMATSRLNRNLRLDKHWSYGSFAMLPEARGQRPFAVVAPVQTDKTKEAMVEVAAEIQGIAGRRPIAGEELESILRNMVLRLPGRFETLSSLENAAQNVVNFGYPPEYYYEYAQNVRRLTAQELNGAAAKFIRPDRLIWIVVGDLAQIEQGVRELGLGELIRLDADGRPVAR